MTPTLYSSLPRTNPAEFVEGQDTIVRQSLIGQLQLCEWRVGYSSHEGFLSPVNERMVFGTCVHYLAEQDLKTGEEQTGLLLNMGEWVNTILVDQYDWDLERVENPHEFFSEIGVAYRTWRKQIRPSLLNEPVGVEAEMLMFLGEGNKGNIWLKGTADAVFEDHVRDSKTAGRGWKKDKADLSIQASLYLALVKNEFGLKTRTFKFDVYDRSKSKWETISVDRRVKDINAALRTAYDSGLKIEAGIYTASPVPEASFQKRRGWYCSANYCGAWNICDYKYMADNVNENIVAIRSWN